MNARLLVSATALAVAGLVAAPVGADTQRRDGSRVMQPSDSRPQADGQRTVVRPGATDRAGDRATAPAGPRQPPRPGGAGIMAGNNNTGI